MPQERIMRRRAWVGVTVAIGGSFGLALFPLLAQLPLLTNTALFAIGTTLALVTSAGAILAVFSLRQP